MPTNPVAVASPYTVCSAILEIQPSIVSPSFVSSLPWYGMNKDGGNSISEHFTEKILLPSDITRKMSLYVGKMGYNVPKSESNIRHVDFRNNGFVNCNSGTIQFSLLVH